MKLLEDIESRFDFKYLELYKQLHYNNFLDWGMPSQNWFRDIYPKLKDVPPFLLYAQDFEVLYYDQIVEEIECFIDPKDYRNTNPEFKFIPFAKSGAGDLYCFMYSNTFNKNDIPIVLVWHDSSDAEIKSKNIEDFIFRQLLETVVDIWENSLVMDGDFKSNILNMFRSHKQFLSEKRQSIIEEIYSREIFTYSYKAGHRAEEAKGLLTYEELEGLLNTEIAFDKLDEVFDYTRPVIKEEETEENKRRVGTVFLKITPIPQKGNQVYEKLKLLNWRQTKSNDTNDIEFYRKGSVIFGKPSIQTIDDTFKEKLIELKANFNGVSITYQDDETKILYEI